MQSNSAMKKKTDFSHVVLLYKYKGCSKHLKWLLFTPLSIVYVLLIQPLRYWCPFQGFMKYWKQQWNAISRAYDVPAFSMQTIWDQMLHAQRTCLFHIAPRPKYIANNLSICLFLFGSTFGLARCSGGIRQSKEDLKADNTQTHTYNIQVVSKSIRFYWRSFSILICLPGKQQLDRFSKHLNQFKQQICIYEKSCNRCGRVMAILLIFCHTMPFWLAMIGMKIKRRAGQSLWICTQAGEGA